jgi:hypothetical protein
LQYLQQSAARVVTDIYRNICSLDSQLRFLVVVASAAKRLFFIGVDSKRHYM